MKLVMISFMICLLLHCRSGLPGGHGKLALAGKLCLLSFRSTGGIVRESTGLCPLYLRSREHIEVQDYLKDVEYDPSDKGMRKIIVISAEEMDDKADDRDPERIREDRVKRSDHSDIDAFRNVVNGKEEQERKECRNLYNAGALKVDVDRDRSFSRIDENDAISEICLKKACQLAEYSCDGGYQTCKRYGDKGSDNYHQDEESTAASCQITPEFESRPAQNFKQTYPQCDCQNG